MARVRAAALTPLESAHFAMNNLIPPRAAPHSAGIQNARRQCAHGNHIYYYHWNLARESDATYYRRMNKRKMLLSISADAKTVKGQAKGYLTGIMYLAPADASGIMNTCPNAGACKAPCLFTAGRASFTPSIITARIAKTKMLAMDRAAFLESLRHSIRVLIRKAARENMIPAVRINGTSDLPWIAMQMAAEFSEVQFYDYTKLAHPWTRARANYHLTQSFDPITVPVDVCMDALAHGINAAVVFQVKRGAPLPAMWHGIPVYDGDQTDLRFTDPKGVIVGVRAKGRAKTDASGFVQIAGACK